ncbi:MAG: SufD family Fe-S cluster assembly protein [Candidatus Magasanikbacteria bacterium]|nr:SufD family Fe-S cluster assembly protein [Candidatus Magasanikbacteria bacterium]
MSKRVKTAKPRVAPPPRQLYDASDQTPVRFAVSPGLSEEIIREISRQKQEPAWLLEKRLKAWGLFTQTPVPTWGADLSKLDLDKIVYFVRPDAAETKNWAEVPAEIKKTFDRLGIPEAEKKALAGVGAQYDSDVVYHKLKKQWEDKGVIFENMDVAVQKYPELVKKYFMTQCIPINDHKFAMLHAAVWSGGTFIYVPKNVSVDLPLQAYFRMNARGGGQFEHTLIIVDEGAQLHYIEGCFVKGTYIKTDKGDKTIESIKIGDKVMTHTGVYKPVYHTQTRRHTGELYNIIYYGDSTANLLVTNEHPFLAVKRQHKNEKNETWEKEWIKPPQLTKHDYLTIPINKTIRTAKKCTFTIKTWNNTTKAFYNKKISVLNVPEFYRLIGYYLAEGSISGGYYLNFSFGIEEIVYIEDVENILTSLFGVKKVHHMVHKTNHGVSLVACSVQLARIFEQFGKKNNLKQLPNWAITESLENQKQLIKGYFRGDGNYYNRRHASGFKETFRMNTTSKKLTYQMRDILLRLKIPAFINLRDRKKEHRQPMYTIGISGNHMKSFGNIVGLPVPEKMHGKKRASRFYIDDNYAYYPIKSIQKRMVKKLPVYNFSVLDNESYMANGVTVHNCSAPRYGTSSLHAGGVEIFVGRGARMRYSSIENWSHDTYNLNTKRALVDEDGIMEWVNGNLGSCTTMLYPCSILRGRGSRSDSLGIAFAGPGQNQDTGAKAIHAAPHTSSTIVSKSISVNGGINTFRGLIKIMPMATNVNASMVCDALLIGNQAIANTIPELKIKNDQVQVAHEARVGKIGEEEIFFLQSRGLNEQEATRLVVSGFIEPIVKALPVEYALELNRLIEMEMDGAVG